MRFRKQCRTTPSSIYMKMALEEAQFAGGRGEIPVGAVLVNAASDFVIKSGNRCEELKDPTAHAEMLVIREAAEKLGDIRLPQCDLYVTLEPCPMCASAVSHARIRRLYFGAYDPKSGGVDHGAKVFSHATCHHKPEIYSGIMETESAQILKDFFKNKR